MRYKIFYLVVAAFAMSSVYSATPIAAPYSAFTDWVPVIMAAVFLSIALAGVYYLIGYLLNNNRIKSSAINELEQAAGSVILVLIIIGVLLLVGSIGSQLSFAGLFGSTTSDFSKICNNYLEATPGNPVPIWMLSSNLWEANQQGQKLPEPTTAVCGSFFGTPSSNGPSLSGSIDPVTTNIDFGLAATYVVIANMTNQSISELNALYNLDSILFFLRNLQPYLGFCEPITCADPLTPDLVSMQLVYSPYKGYILQRTIMPTIVTQAVMTTYLMTIQLIMVLLLLMFWPYLLGASIVLRTIPFTRRAGGLILAATVVGVLILPTLFLLEYSTLNNLNPPGLIRPPAPGSVSVIGSGQIPGMALCGFGPIQGSGGPPGGTGYSVLYCYTGASELKTSYIYKDIQPPGLPATMDACPVGFLNTESAVGPEPDPFDVASFRLWGGWPSATVPCYVKMQISLYAFPNAANLINFYSCYPMGKSTILTTEGEILTAALISNVFLVLTAPLSLFSNNFSLGSNSIVDFFFNPSGASCISQIAPRNMMAALTSLINMYGIISVAGFILPILNALILLSAMTGLSSLIGGETTIIGLTRFL